MKEIEDANKWKCVLSTVINIIKVSIYSKVIYRSNVNPIKIPVVLLTEIEKKVL
jgi:hypothetical protein